MPGTNEAFSRVRIDAQLKDQGWDVLHPNAVRFECVLPDRTKADYVLCDRHGRALAVVEAKKAAINPTEAEAQAKAYATQLEVPCIFLANGEEIRFWEWQREAYRVAHGRRHAADLFKVIRILNRYWRFAEMRRPSPTTP